MPRAPRRCPANGCDTLIVNRRYCGEHTVAWSGERTVSSRITATDEWREFRLTILERDGWLCRLQLPGICTGRATQVDKRVPAHRRPGWALDPSNAQAACAECNGHKARTTDKGVC